MKLKLKQIWASQQAMPKLLNRELADVKTSYFVGKNARALDVEYGGLNQKRILLVKKHGIEDTKSNQWNVPKEKMEQFNKEFESLLESEVDVEITAVDVIGLADAKLTPMDMVSIDFMIKA
jgi:hypothetical protein